ncbi:winged helix-turn-helix domain-containing protein [Altererythrobacter aquiaggeris]|uniref:winged helix-turn-helix domain-containing protein n=1 Tax=Aestuarierythrobacter aquiaggeris TaxID=1898396 RepID=UPI00301AFC73
MAELASAIGKLSSRTDPLVESPYALKTELIPRRLCVGPLILDLFHRDAILERAWVGLNPREFQVIWRLAETPDRPVTRGELIAQVWRLRHDPRTNSVEVHISRLRTKLAYFQADWLVATDPQGGYRIADRATVRPPQISHRGGSGMTDYLVRGRVGAASEGQNRT